MGLCSLVFNINNWPYLTAILVIVIISITKYYASKRKTFWADKNLIEAQSSSMLTMFLKKTRIELAEFDLVRKNGKLFGITQFGAPTIFCTEPELISLVLSKEFTSFPNRRSFKLGNDPLVENMLSIITDDHWKRIRAIVSPTFSTGKLRKMRPLINDCLNTLVDNFNQLIKENKDIDMKRFYGAFSMNVVIQVAFGTKVDALIDENNAIIKNARKFLSKDFTIFAIIKFITIFTFPKIAKFLDFRLISRDITNFFEDFTLRIIKERKNNKSTVKRYDFLQLMLDAMDNENVDEDNDKNVDNNTDHDMIFEEQKFVTHNKTMSDVELISQCILFFFAGYETTATTLSLATYNIACNPDVQRKLYEEAKTVFASKEELDYDSIQKLEYLDAVISETLRVYPPGTAIERVASEDIVLGNEQIKVKKGDVLHIPVYALHRDPDIFPEPESFKPERFLPENRSHHPYAYLPFGAGPRNCVARRLALMEAKLALLYTVYYFKLSPTDKTKQPPEFFHNKGSLIPRNIFLKVEKR